MNKYTHGLTASEAHADIALESYIVAARKFERIEIGHQGLGLRILFPLPKYRGIRRAAVFVRYNVLVLQIILHRFSDAIPRESTINSCNIVILVSAFSSRVTEVTTIENRASKLYILLEDITKLSTLTRRLNLHLQHQIVSDFGRIDLVSVLRDYLHQAYGWWASIGDRSSGRQHRNVKAEGDVLLSSLVYTFDVISLRFVSHQLRVFLYDEHEASLPLEDE